MRAIIFDLDGTLVDSIDDIAEALIAALGEHGYAPPDRALVRTWVGGGARALVAHAVSEDQVDAIVPTFLACYARRPVVMTRLYDGIAPVLDALAKKATLAVLSNKPHSLTQAICAQLLAPWPFARIDGARPGVPMKPAPDGALAIAAALGATDCCYVGDAVSDIACARAAGMIPVAVSWGYRPRAELVAAQPKVLADSPADLLALV